MKYLLDTRVWLWMQAQPHKLGPTTLMLLRDERNEFYLSAASAWEIALKFRRGELTLPDRPEEYVPDRMLANGVKGIAVEVSHALAVAVVDGDRRDPIDRLLLGQAIVEDMPIVTADPRLAMSGVTVIDATA